MQGAFCRAPNGGRRGGLSHRRWRARCEGSRAWTRPLALRPLLQESDGPRRAWEWAAQSICEWARRSIREWAKTAILDAAQKRQRRSPCDASRQIYFIAWVACAREIDGPNVFGCDRSGRGIDFLAASGFNDVSSTGILTYS